VFAPAPMKKISILVLDRDLRNVARSMGRAGVIHLETGAGEAEFGEPVDRRAFEERLEAIKNRTASLQRALDIAPGDFEPAGDDELIAPLLAERELDVMERQTDRVDAELRGVRAEIEQLEGAVNQLEGLEELDVPVEELPSFSFLHFALGEGSDEQVSELKRSAGKTALVFSVNVRPDKERFVAVTDKKGRFALQTAIEKSGAATADISGRYKGVAMEILARCRERLTQLRETEERLQATLRGLREKYGGRLAVLARWAAIERSVLDAGESFLWTSKTCTISGWIPAVREQEVLKELRRVTGGRMVAQLSEPGDEEPPVLLRHNPLLAPFAGLVMTYSTPRYREVEPTLFVAVAFLLMFGLMFGDVGHGAVLVVMGLALLKWGATEVMRQGGMLLLLCGCSAAVFGFLFGSVFGNEDLIAPLWMTPAEPTETMRFLGYMILFGVALISLGLVLSVVNRIRTGDYYHAFLDKTGVIGALFYWGAVGLAIKAMKSGAVAINSWELILLVAAPLVILFFREPLYAIATKKKKLYHEGVLTGVMEAVVEMMETVTSFLANTISFVRIGAFALAHAMLMMAVIQLAGMSSGVGSVIILVLGNALAIVLEGMVVAIQVLRLQYYEFFGKFFMGGGKKYDPFTTP